MNKISHKQNYWTAVWALFGGVTCLIAAEFLPVSLLTSIAKDLSITEGIAGQSITVVGIFAVISSLLTASITKRIDRRVVLLTLSSLLVAANLIVAFAPNYTALLIGRALLGICVGGFWSLASAVILHLVEKENVPKAFSIVYAGVSVATIISLPLGSLLGELIGWRHVFITTALLSFIILVFQKLSLPTLKSNSTTSFKSMCNLLKVRWVLIGMFATIFSYGGYHIVFTYLKPFLELNLKLSSFSLTLVLLIFGIANCLGTFIAGFILGKQFRLVMIMIHLSLSLVAFLLYLSQDINETLILVTLWGFIFGFIPVGWSTWITKVLPHQAEMLGGLSVAVIQFSIGLVAALGGVVFDHIGIQGIFVLASIIALSASILLALSFRLFYLTTQQKI